MSATSVTTAKITLTSRRSLSSPRRSLGHAHVLNDRCLTTTLLCSTTRREAARASATCRPGCLGGLPTPSVTLPPTSASHHSSHSNTSPPQSRPKARDQRSSQQHGPERDTSTRPCAICSTATRRPISVRSPSGCLVSNIQGTSHPRLLFLITLRAPDDGVLPTRVVDPLSDPRLLHLLPHMRRLYHNPSPHRRPETRKRTLRRIGHPSSTPTSPPGYGSHIALSSSPSATRPSPHSIRRCPVVQRGSQVALLARSGTGQ